MNQLAIIDHLKTAIGAVRVTANELGVLQVDLPGRRNNTHPALNRVALSQAQQIARSAMEQILDYLDGKRKVFEISIDWSFSTPFQRNVLEITRCIPFGECLTYGQIAEKLGKTNASRAVGGALAQNPIPLIIPCHRVVAANGNLTGFSAAEGILTKQWLLQLEGRKIVAQKLV